jgi:lipoprotein-releasing system ATP-binding protein
VSCQQSEPLDFIQWRHCDMNSSTSVRQASTESGIQKPHVSFPKEANQPTSQKPVKSEVVLQACGVTKNYFKNKIKIPVLRGIDLEVRSGEQLAIIGQSGSGKSTLLHLLGTLDNPGEGEIFFEGNRIDNLPNSARDVLRNKYFGLIFQFYHLLPELTTLENVVMPLMISDGIFKYWWQKKANIDRAKELLELVGLGHRWNHRPSELSGGEMQRAAIARSLITNPKLLLADEPTGNLDGKTGQEILEILRSLNEEQNLTIVMVTHDESIAADADRTIRLKDGLVEAA